MADVLNTIVHDQTLIGAGTNKEYLGISEEGFLRLHENKDKEYLKQTASGSSVLDFGWFGTQPFAYTKLGNVTLFTINTGDVLRNILINSDGYNHTVVYRGPAFLGLISWENILGNPHDNASLDDYIGKIHDYFSMDSTFVSLINILESTLG